MSIISSLAPTLRPVRNMIPKRYPLPFLREAVLRCVERRGARWSFFDARDVPRITAREKHACFTVAFDTSLREQWLDAPLHALAAKLAPLGFVRVHRSELVNLRFLRAIVRRRRVREGLMVELMDGQRVQVSRRYAARLREALEALVAVPSAAALDPSERRALRSATSASGESVDCGA